MLEEFPTRDDRYIGRDTLRSSVERIYSQSNSAGIQYKRSYHDRAGIDFVIDSTSSLRYLPVRMDLRGADT